MIRFFTLTALSLLMFSLMSCEEETKQTVKNRPQRNLYGLWELAEAHQSVYIDDQLQKEQFDAIFYQKPILKLNTDGTFVDSEHEIPGLWKFSATKKELLFDINEGEKTFCENCHIDELTENSLTYSCVKEEVKIFQGKHHTIRTEKVMHFIKPSIEL